MYKTVILFAFCLYLQYRGKQYSCWSPDSDWPYFKNDIYYAFFAMLCIFMLRMQSVFC